MEQLMKSAIGVALAMFVAAILLPSALGEIYGADTSGWNTAVITMFQVLLPVLGIIGIAVAFFRGAGAGGG